MAAKRAAGDAKTRIHVDNKLAKGSCKQILFTVEYCLKVNEKFLYLESH